MAVCTWLGVSIQVLCCISHTDAPGGTAPEREVVGLRLPVFDQEADAPPRVTEWVNPNKNTR